MWLLALVGAWRRRHSGRIVLALLVLTYSPVLVLFGQAYGNEGILRVYLFSLPWAAALAAAAVEPGPLSRKMMPRLRAATGSLDFSWIRPALRWLRAPVTLLIVIALFFVAFYGDDAFDTFPQSEVTAIQSFLQSARPGPVYVAEDNVPASDTDRYYLFPLNRHLRLPRRGAVGKAGDARHRHADRQELQDVHAGQGTCLCADRTEHGAVQRRVRTDTAR